MSSKITLLMSNDEDDHAALVRPGIDAHPRVPFDTLKLLTLIELVEMVHGANPDLRHAMHKANNRLNTIIKPVHGKMMIEKRS